MFAIDTKIRVAVALLLWFAIVFLLSYFSFRENTANSKTHLNSFQPANLREHSTAADLQDIDGDGLPEFLELKTFNDRESFRRWFTWIAEVQFYKISDQWNTDQRDCAGLARFAWKEALRRHDRSWYKRMGLEYSPIAADVSFDSSQLAPEGKLFRTKPGPFVTDDFKTDALSDFADAQTLKTYNCDFVSRRRQQAEPGDLLFFYQPWVQKFPFHVMIFIGEAHLAKEGARDWVIYHTGPSSHAAGTIKKVRLAVLDQHPDKRWRPVTTNPNFLGFYRLRILTQSSLPER
ncbi:MAG: DUF1175 family protein [Pyrinomonadaceae bacterium]